MRVLALLSVVRALCSDTQTARFRVGPGEFAITEGWGLPGGVRGTGARVWPASVALARFIVAHPQTVCGKRCVEVGAGVGGLPALAVLPWARSSSPSTFCRRLGPLWETNPVQS